jgi:hypothetical protein
MESCVATYFSCIDSGLISANSLVSGGSCIMICCERTRNIYVGIKLAHFV